MSGKYKIEVFCNGELQTSVDSANAERDVRMIKQVLKYADPKSLEGLKSALDKRNDMAFQNMARMFNDRKRLELGCSLCLPCYGLKTQAEQERLAEYVQSLLEDGLVAVLDANKKGVLKIVKGNFNLPTKEKICRDNGWFPVSHLMAAWEKSETVIALRAVHPEIDQATEDAWGPESGLKFWNAPSGEYSHALTWDALFAEQGYTNKTQDTPPQ